MRNKPLLIFITVFGLMVQLLNCNLLAEEKTGREFNELISELNNELSTAKQKVEKIEEKRLEKNIEQPDMILPQRAEALKDLEKLTSQMDKAKEPENKKILAEKVEKKILEVSELSTDFLESMKVDLQAQDQQLEVIEESLSGVIMKMDKLRELVNNNLGEKASAITKLKARKSLHNLAQMVEIFAEKHKNAQQWSHIRKTIMLQDKILSRGTASTDNIQKMLNNQQQVFEQVLAQVSVARGALQTEKEILAQVGLGEIAKSMLRKASGLLLGNQKIHQIGESAFIQSEVRQQNIMDFLDQDNSEGIYNGVETNVTYNSNKSEFPDGYKDYLKGIE